MIYLIPNVLIWRLAEVMHNKSYARRGAVHAGSNGGKITHKLNLYSTSHNFRQNH